LSPASTIHALALRSHSSHNSREHGSSCDRPCAAVWCGTVLLSQELAGDTVYSGMARRRPWLWPWLASALVAVAVSYAYLSLTGPGEHNRHVGSAESLRQSSSNAIVAPPDVEARSLGLCGTAALPPPWSECTACASTHVRIDPVRLRVPWWFQALPNSHPYMEQCQQSRLWSMHPLTTASVVCWKSTAARTRNGWRPCLQAVWCRLVQGK